MTYYDRQYDIFAAGASAYEMLTGKQLIRLDAGTKEDRYLQHKYWSESPSLSFPAQELEEALRGKKRIQPCLRAFNKCYGK